MLRQIRRWCFQLRDALAIQRVKPAIIAPGHFLDRGLAPQNTAAAILERATAEINHVSLTRLGLDEIGMARTLRRRIRTRPGAENIRLGMKLIRPEQIACPR